VPVAVQFLFLIVDKSDYPTFEYGHKFLDDFMIWVNIVGIFGYLRVSLNQTCPLVRRFLVRRSGPSLLMGLALSHPQLAGN